MSDQPVDIASSSQARPGSPSEPTLPGENRKHHKLVEWVLQQGGFVHDNLVIAYDDAGGYHAKVAEGKAIAKDTRIASCPMEATMCVLNALDIEPFSCRGVRFPRTFLDKFSTSPDLLHSFFLMEHYLLGDRSWWSHYIATLPSPDEVKATLFDLPEDRLWIQGTNLDSAVDLQTQKWQDSYFTGLEELERAEWSNARNQTLTWDLFRWAAVIFGTRSFTSQVLSDTTPADIARPLGRQERNHQLLSKLFSDRFAVLLPLLDILNHRPGAQIEWQARYSYVGLQILEPYESGQEVFNNYGPRDNESLLLSYGFVLESNKFDHVVVSIKVPPDSPLADARTWPTDTRSNEHFNCYIFGPDHPIVSNNSSLERAFFSYDLLDSISVLISNDRELQAMYTSQKTIMSSYLGGSFPDFHNFLATITQILQDCRGKILRLRYNDPSSQDPPLIPKTSKQRYAQTYRDGQLALLQNATAVCAFVILRASTKMRQEDLLLTMQVRMTHFYSQHLDRIVRNQSCITKQNELLTIDAIVEMVPEILRDRLESCIKSITHAQDELKSLPTCHSDVMKSGFAISLSALCCERANGTNLGPRLTPWLNELVQWYPPTDENWSYVPHPGPWAPGEQPPQALMTLLSVIASQPEAHTNPWLRTQMICWGWNVMEEEGVRVPIEVERFCNGLIEADAEEGAIGFLLYCKQYV